MSGITQFFDSMIKMRPVDIGLSGAAEIIILAFLIYHILLWIKNSRA